MKTIMVLEDEHQKEKLMEQHQKVGKSFKTDVLNMEKEFEAIETQLIVILTR